MFFLQSSYLFYDLCVLLGFLFCCLSPLCALVVSQCRSGTWWCGGRHVFFVVGRCVLSCLSLCFGAAARGAGSTTCQEKEKEEGVTQVPLK